jgi:hypothetical protein
MLQKLTRKVLNTMKNTLRLSASLVFTAMLGVALSASAQSGSGSIRGTVEDPSGALIPGAQITVSNAEGFTHRYESDAEGRFYVSQLEPGSYSVSVSATDFTAALKSVDVTGNSVTRESIKLGISVDQELEVYAR